MFGGLLPGRIVHYVPDLDDSPPTLEDDGVTIAPAPHYAAIVTRVIDRRVGVVDLQLFLPEGAPSVSPGRLRSVDYGTRRGSWHEMAGCDGVSVHREI